MIGVLIFEIFDNLDGSLECVLVFLHCAERMHGMFRCVGDKIPQHGIGYGTTGIAVRGLTTFGPDLQMILGGGGMLRTLEGHLARSAKYIRRSARHSRFRHI